jgi:hypothetical protein
MHHMKMIKTFSVVFLLTIVYILLFLLNDYFFSSYAFSSGVDWVYLPSGLRLVFVLVFINLGALSVGLSTLVIGYFYFFDGNLVTIVGAGFISGFAPWCARKICIQKYKMDPNLRDLSASALLKIALVFSVVSPVMHQLWLTWRGETESFVQSTLVMAIGDLLGTLLVLYSIKFLMSGVSGLTHKSYNKSWFN